MPRILSISALFILYSSFFSFLFSLLPSRRLLQIGLVGNGELKQKREERREKKERKKERRKEEIAQRYFFSSHFFRLLSFSFSSFLLLPSLLFDKKRILRAKKKDKIVQRCFSSSAFFPFLFSFFLFLSYFSFSLIFPSFLFLHV